MSLLSNRSAMVLFHDDIGHRSQKVRIVISEKGISCNLEVLNKDDLPKEILEINPEHDIVIKLKEKTRQKAFDDIAWLLYEQALIQEGVKLEDPSGFVDRLNNVIADTL